MAGSLNKVQLIGRLGADPEIKQMVNGKSVARLSIATSQSWKDKSSGERKEKTEWHRVVIFNEGLVNVVQQYVKSIFSEKYLTTIGVKIDKKTIEVEDVSYVQNAPKKEIGLKIKHIGNSVIRNIFDHLGYDVVKVDCVTIGPLTKKDLPRGRWRHVTEQEMNTFSML